MQYLISVSLELGDGILGSIVAVKGQPLLTDTWTRQWE